MISDWEYAISQLDPCPKCGYQPEPDPVEKGILCSCSWAKDIKSWKKHVKENEDKS